MAKRRARKKKHDKRERYGEEEKDPRVRDASIEKTGGHGEEGAEERPFQNEERLIIAGEPFSKLVQAEESKNKHPAARNGQYGGQIETKIGNPLGGGDKSGKEANPVRAGNGEHHGEPIRCNGEDRQSEWRLFVHQTPPGSELPRPAEPGHPLSRISTVISPGRQALRPGETRCDRFRP